MKETPLFAESKSLAECRQELLSALEKEERLRINPVDFRGVPGFTDQEIMDDVRRVQEKQRMIADEQTNLPATDKKIYEDSRLLESVLFSSIKDSHWLGEKTGLVIPSLYDDYFRGVDAIAEFAKEKSDPRHIGFSIDFTMSPETLAKKMMQNIETLSKGFVPSVKYFNSPILGKRKNVWMPRIILGADYASVKRIADAYIEAHAQGGTGERDVLANDPAQFVLLDEIRAQLRAFRNMAYEYFNNEKAGGIFQRAFVTFMEVLKERGIDEKILHTKARGDSLHARLLSLIGKFDRGAIKK